MGAKLLWRRIKIFHINIVLYLLIVCVTILYWPQLQWAMNSLPGYLKGSIISPPERTLYRKAKRILQKGHAEAKAYSLLEQSLSIDPNSRASYWLGHYYNKTHQYDKALLQYIKYVKMDPTMVEVYLQISSIFEKRNQLKKAQKALQKGLDYFIQNAHKYKPHHDDNVRSKYNKKATKVYDKYWSSVRTLRREIRRITAKETLSRQKECPLKSFENVSGLRDVRAERA